MKSRLTVIAGHGGADPGAVKDVDNDADTPAVRELDLNIAAVLSFNDVASREYVPHDVTVTTYPAPLAGQVGQDGDAVLARKIEEAQHVGPDQVLLEVHHNVGGAGSGCQIWYSQRADEKPGDETWLIAPMLAQELGFLVGHVVPIISSERSRFGKLGILDDVDCTALLLEARNVDTIATPEWEYSIGAALAKVFAKVFGWPSSAPVVETPAPAPDADPQLVESLNNTIKILSLKRDRAVQLGRELVEL